jgi:hypothetical protein
MYLNIRRPTYAAEAYPGVCLLLSMLTRMQCKVVNAAREVRGVAAACGLEGSGR